jgi:hypothetical protein
MPQLAPLPLAVAAAALLCAAYVGLRGLGWVRYRERPERIIGRVIKFRDVEPDFVVSVPAARVASYDGNSYLAQLASPVHIEGREHVTVRISARWRGFPISSASRWRVRAANCQFPDGCAFIALVALGDA